MTKYRKIYFKYCDKYNRLQTDFVHKTVTGDYKHTDFVIKDGSFYSYLSK